MVRCETSGEYNFKIDRQTGRRQTDTDRQRRLGQALIVKGRRKVTSLPLQLLVIRMAPSADRILRKLKGARVVSSLSLLVVHSIMGSLAINGILKLMNYIFFIMAEYQVNLDKSMK